MDPNYERETGRMRAEMERIERWIKRRADTAGRKLGGIQRGAPSEEVSVLIVLGPIWVVFILLLLLAGH